MSMFETYELEGEFEGEGEFEFEGEFEGEGEFEFEGEFEGEGEGEFEFEAPLHESMELELASELLEINNEYELEQFLGGLIKGAGRFLKSNVGRNLTGILKSVAKKALPVVGGALGSFVAPGLGTAIGSKLGSAAAGLFELEFEGLSQSQAEFEVARRVVRLTTAAAQQASRAPVGAPAAQVARTAVATAARRHAPGLVRPGGPLRPVAGMRPRRRVGPRPRYIGPRGVAGPARRRPSARYARSGTGVVGPSYVDDWYGGEPAGGGSWADDGGGAASGRWSRRGNKIVLFGI